MKTFQFWKSMIWQELIVLNTASMMLKAVFEIEAISLIIKTLQLSSFLLVIPCMLMANKYAKAEDKKFLPKHMAFAFLVFATSLMFFVAMHFWLK